MGAMEEIAAQVPQRRPRRFLEGLTSEQRKQYPVASGVLDYFPDALAMVAHLSWVGNEKHNPGQPLHWARGKSGDESDAMIRHFITRDNDDHYAMEDGTVISIPHHVMVAWRALADLQKWMEKEYDLSLPRGAKS